MKHTVKKGIVVMMAMCLLTGNGFIFATESENPVVDIGAVESDKYYGVMINDVETSAPEYVYSVTTGDGQQYSGSSEEPFGEITVNAEQIDVTDTSMIQTSGVAVNNETPATITINIENDISVDGNYQEATSTSSYGIKIDSSEDGMTDVSGGNVSVSAEGDESATAQGINVTTENDGTVSMELGDVSATAFASSEDPKTDFPSSNAIGINIGNMGTMNAETDDITASASASQVLCKGNWSQCTGYRKHYADNREY